MKTISKYSLIAVLVVAVAGIAAVGAASAQGDDPPFRGRDAMAELLGLSPEELHEQIQAGKTIEELAEDAGVDLEGFRDQMMNNRQESLRERIREALEDDEISQDQADWLLEGLEKGYLNGPFFQPGSRPGFDGKRGPGMRGGSGAE